MDKLKNYQIQNGCLVANDPQDIFPLNKFVFSGVAQDNEDVPRDFKYNIFDVEPFVPENGKMVEEGHVLLKINGIPLISTFTIDLNGVEEKLFSQVKNDIKSLKGDRYEIWPKDHNVNDEVHLPDPFGATTQLLSLLENRLPINRPPFNHNKVSSKKYDRFGCNHMHIDSFEGMRTDNLGQRKEIDRYFINFGDSVREILIAVLSPNMLSCLVPLQYEKDLLSKLFSEANYELDILKFKTLPVDFSRKIAFGLKIRSTHVLHGEYGAKGDFLAIINSLPGKQDN